MYVQIGTEPICLDDVAAFPAGINVIHVHSKIKVSGVTDNCVHMLRACMLYDVFCPLIYTLLARTMAD